MVAPAPASVSIDSLSSDALMTLNEPISTTFMRDLNRVGKKLKTVLLPVTTSTETLKELRDWDLWGPLLLCLLLSIITSSHAPSGQTSLVFASVFVLVWVGAAVVTLNAKLLGGKMCVGLRGCMEDGKGLELLQLAPTPPLSDHWRPASASTLFFFPPHTPLTSPPLLALQIIFSKRVCSGVLCVPLGDSGSAGVGVEQCRVACTFSGGGVLLVLQGLGGVYERNGCPHQKNSGRVPRVPLLPSGELDGVHGVKGGGGQ